MSNLSTIPLIAERSEATPGLWNQPFTTIQNNFDALNSDVTLSLPSSQTWSLFTNLDASGNLHATERIGIGPTPSADSTGVLTIATSSATADYIQLTDSSAARSSYLIGSRVGGTGDGLNLYDTSGNTMIVSFSKQSVRFYAPVVGSITDTGGALYNVRSYGALGDGTTDDTATIQATIEAASSAGGGTVFFPNGQYNVTSALTLRTRVSLQGSGRTAKISTSSQSINLFSGTGVGDIFVSNLFFEHAGNDQTDVGSDGGNVFQLSQCSQIDISECWFEKHDDGVFASDCTALHVRSNFFRRYAGAAARWLHVEDSIFEGNQCDGARPGIGNQQAGVNGIWLSATGNGYTNNCVVANNEIRNVSFEAILVIAHHCSIVGNSQFSALNGVNMQTGSTETQQPTIGGSFNAVVGNMLRNQNNLGAGIRIGHSSGNNTVAAHDNVVVGNVIDVTNSSALDLQQDAYNNLIANNYVTGAVQHGIASGVSSVNNQILGNSVYSSRLHGIFIQGGSDHVIAGNRVHRSLQDGIRIGGTSSNCVVRDNHVTDSDVSTSGSWANIDIGPSGSVTTVLVTGNRCYNTVIGSFANQGIAVGGASTATGIALIGNDCRGNKAVTRGINANANPTAFLLGNLAGSATTSVEERSMVGDGSSIFPGLGFSSDFSLGFYHSGQSAVGLSYGQFQVPVGSAVLPPLTFSSESSLGFFRSGASIMGISYGQLGGAGTGSSAGTPSFSFVGDSDTGIYRVQANFLGVAAGGQDAMYFTNLQARFAGVGSTTTPNLAWNSEASLGIYRSATSTIALSYGTLDLTGGGAVASLASIKIKSGTNNSCGTAVLGSNGSVNVANTYVATGDLIFLTDQAPGGTLGDLEILGIRAGSGFTIASTGLTDTSTVAWLIVRPT